MPGLLSLTRLTRSLPHPYTVSGRLFTHRSAVILKAVARSREYTDGLWVPMQMVEPLGLALRSDGEHAVRLDAMNGTCFYYHSSQFPDSAAAIRARWEAWRKASSTPSATAAPPLPVAGDATFLPPLTTNGEPLTTDATAEVQRRFLAGERWATRYWATPEEAAYIFDAPFRTDYLADAHRAVPVENSFATPHRLAYFNVEGTTAPARFTTATCRRYDPYNYNGEFYSTTVSLAMKRLLVQHGGLDCPRWMTPERVAWFGSALLPGATPLLLFVEEKCLSLVNLTHTRHPTYLEACAVNTKTMGGGGARGDTDNGLEQTLLLTTVDDCDEPIPQDMSEPDLL